MSYLPSLQRVHGMDSMLYMGFVWAWVNARHFDGVAYLSSQIDHELLLHLVPMSLILRHSTLTLLSAAS
jgi:hypothetical protein